MGHFEKISKKNTENSDNFAQFPDLFFLILFFATFYVGLTIKQSIRKQNFGIFALIGGIFKNQKNVIII
jgi:hypothetical protein